MPDDTSADPLRLVADLRRQLAACSANLKQRTIDRDEALAQQAAAAEILRLINSSPGNLAPVFDAMLDKAMRLCAAAFGELRTYDGERFRLAAMRGAPAAYAEYFTQMSSNFEPGSGPARILEGERVIHVVDLIATDLYQSGDCNRRALVDLGGARAYVLVALVKADDVLGYIMIYRQEPRPSPKDRSHRCKTSPIRRSSRWRRRGCSANCASERAISRSRSNTRLRPATF